jgi:hypothetical protein
MITRLGLVVLLAWLAALACFIAAFKAPARDLGQWADAPLHAWFDHLASDRGPCCSFADGVSIADVDWDNLGTIDDVNSGYRVRLDGKWIDVPKTALITEPNKDGRAFVWPYSDGSDTPQIRCFLPGAGT